VVWSTLFLAALIKSSTSRQARFGWWVWLILICASTVLVHQHHMIDVVSGLGLAAVLHRWSIFER
jgi:membrane-associated phospholipid phosphatase